MLDSNAILVLMAISGATGFVINLISENIGKIVAVMAVFSLAVFLVTAVNSGMNIDNISDLSFWITSFITNLVPLILAYASEGVGATLGVRLRNAI